jgi:hypothetical protein
MPSIITSARCRSLRVVLVLASVAALLSAITVGTTEAVAQPAPGLDADVVAGYQAAPDVGFLANVAACNRHVDKNGDDTTGTSLATAWRTIAKAMQLLQPGQTACVHAGVYDEGPIAAANSGTSQAPIAVTAAPGEPRPVVRATTNQSLFDITAGPQVSKGYWLIDGFEIDKRQRDGASIRVEGDGGGHAHHVVIRANWIHSGKSGAAVLVRNRATDVLVYNNDINNHHRFELWKNYGTAGAVRHQVDFAYNPPSPLPPGFTYGRSDANAVNVESESSVLNKTSVERVRLRSNRLYDNGGDGFQCIGANDSGNVSYEADARDIDLVDNTVRNNAEDAVDIKSCRFVSIRGSVRPDRERPAADNKLMHYRPTDKSKDLPGNHSGGGAVVIHFNARGVMIENTRIFDACSGISIGVPRTQVRDVIIRRTLLFDISRGLSADCAVVGNGIRITNASHVDVYHNTLDNLGGKALMIASDNTGPPSGKSVLSDIDVWNNIFSRSRYWIDLLRQFMKNGQVVMEVNGFASDRNLFWNPSPNPPAPPSKNHFILDFNLATLEQWRNSTGQDLTSIHADPQFVANPALDDYYTQPGSLARDAAIPIPGYGVPPCPGWPSPNPPDIGFRESSC